MKKTTKISLALFIVAALSYVPYILGTWDIIYSQIIGISAMIAYGIIQDFAKK